MKLAIVVVLAGCAQAQQPSPTGLRAEETHEAKAMQRDRAARIAHGNPPTFECGDSVLADQTTSGGERLTLAQPCFDVSEERAVHEELVLNPAAPAATHDREMAANLAETVLHGCRGISEREREHSPFAHKREIAEVTPLNAGSGLAGVRIVFKPVPGLTAEWLERDIQCHQARFAALGEAPDYLPQDPTLVRGAHVTVTERNHQVEVTVVVPDHDAAQLALQRARDLVAPAAAAK